MREFRKAKLAEKWSSPPSMAAKRDSMARTFCLLNHQLTPNQIAELEGDFQSTEIIYPSQSLSVQWSQIKPEEPREKVINEVILWLQEHHAELGDFFIIQGEFGCTFTLVDYALQQEMVPLYATTVRIAKESRDGEQINREYIFQHSGFKRYQYWEKV